MAPRPRTLAVLVSLGSIHVACCGTGDNRQLREEVAVTRNSRIGMGGLIMMPAFTEPGTVEQLRPGTPNERIIELVGPPWRTLPARQGSFGCGTWRSTNATFC